MTTPNILSTSTLSGDKVINNTGQDLGDIKDFMVDLDNGRIVYAVLSFGGFLGMGDKLFAIPFDALEVDLQRECFKLDVNKEILENAPGFDEDNWPTHPNYEFIDKVYTHYGYEPYSTLRANWGETYGPTPERTANRQSVLENTTLN
ncbi:MAG TPA: PRC-barrel domain-containing protein [Rhodothermales bacterium]|nr:PRC-barrel domain-containing protein [Rhodothermales bacterium]